MRLSSVSIFTLLFIIVAIFSEHALAFRNEGCKALIQTNWLGAVQTAASASDETAINIMIIDVVPLSQSLELNVYQLIGFINDIALRADSRCDENIQYNIATMEYAGFVAADGSIDIYAKRSQPTHMSLDGYIIYSDKRNYIEGVVYKKSILKTD